jgi:hypothetical protein
MSPCHREKMWRKGEKNESRKMGEIREKGRNSQIRFYFRAPWH